MRKPEDWSVIREQLAPEGVLRVALNMSNFLLVSTKTASGEPDGVAPSMTRAIATELDVDLKFLCFDGPGLIADAAGKNEWDIATLAAEPARAEVISFSPAYCEIQASYLIPPGSHITSIDQIDASGVRIAVKARAAYDLWLTNNLKHATLQRAESLDASFELFRDEKLDALAGLRPKLLEQQALMPGSVLLNETFTTVQQSIGCSPDFKEAAGYLTDFVHAAKSSGKVEALINHFGMTGRLSVAGL